VQVKFEEAQHRIKQAAAAVPTADGSLQRAAFGLGECLQVPQFLVLANWHEVAAQERPVAMHQSDTEVNGALQGWADALMAAAARLPDEEHAKEVEASERASGLLQRAVQAFVQVP
jgi:hypothetical protein